MIRDRGKEEEIQNRLSQAALRQGMIEEAPMNVISAAKYGRTTSHYCQRVTRYVHMEVDDVGKISPSKLLP